MLYTKDMLLTKAGKEESIALESLLLRVIADITMEYLKEQH